MFAGKFDKELSCKDIRKRAPGRNAERHHDARDGIRRVVRCFSRREPNSGIEGVPAERFGKQTAE